MICPIENQKTIDIPVPDPGGLQRLGLHHEQRPHGSSSFERLLAHLGSELLDKISEGFTQKDDFYNR